MRAGLTRTVGDSTTEKERTIGEAAMWGLRPPGAPIRANK